MPYNIHPSTASSLQSGIANTFDNLSKVRLAQLGVGIRGASPGEAEYNAARTAHENAETQQLQAEYQARQEGGIADAFSRISGIPADTIMRVRANDPTVNVPDDVKNTIRGGTTALTLLNAAGGHQQIDNVLQAYRTGQNLQNIPAATNIGQLAQQTGALLGKPTVEANSGILYDPYGKVGTEGYTVTPVAQALIGTREAQRDKTTATTQPTVDLITSKVGTEKSKQGYYESGTGERLAKTPAEVEELRQRANAHQAAGSLYNEKANTEATLRDPRKQYIEAGTTGRQQQTSTGKARQTNIETDTDVKRQKLPGELRLQQAKITKTEADALKNVNPKDKEATRQIAQAEGYYDKSAEEGGYASQQYIQQTDPALQEQKLTAYKDTYVQTGGDVSAARAAARAVKGTGYQPPTTTKEGGVLGFGATTKHNPAQRSKPVGPAPKRVVPQAKALPSGLPTQGQNDANIELQRARNAIAAGADVNKVTEMLKAKGIDPSHL